MGVKLGLSGEQGAEGCIGRRGVLMDVLGEKGAEGYNGRRGCCGMYWEKRV